ncbi:MAG: pyridoxamine 5'-phosphate oxidase family protein [Candidatus Lokiarchaeota archaeon]|nr:pyridoxamine 5'-phosphate oxidase family protein [Candidatus Lokiarchaeota archaeon]
MELEEIKKLSLELMESSKAAYISTIDSGGYPITRAIFNLRNKEQFPEFSEFFNELDNEFVIFISTNTSSSKTDQVTKNPKISVYYCEPKDFKGVMFVGEVEIINDLNIKKKIWLDWWTKYYHDGLEDPDYTLLRLKPKMAEFYYKLQKTHFKIGEPL